jgi:predicted nucleotidyltransferase
MNQFDANHDLRSSNISREFAQRLREQLGDRIEQVILYGSRARGEAEADSDFDFLVVVDRFSEALENQVLDLAYQMLDQYGAVVSAIVVQADHFQNRLWEPLYVNARREGISL